MCVYVFFSLQFIVFVSVCVCVCVSFFNSFNFFCLETFFIELVCIFLKFSLKSFNYFMLGVYVRIVGL